MSDFPKIQARFDAAMEALDAAMADAGASGDVDALTAKVAALEAEAQDASDAASAQAADMDIYGAFFHIDVATPDLVQ